MTAVTVTIVNPVSGFRRETTTDEMGRFVFRNLPPNPYHVSASAQGFETVAQDVDVRTAIPITADLSMKACGHVTDRRGQSAKADLLEANPSAHTDIDQSRVDKLPIEAAGGLNQVITMASPGVVADSNGFFHPVGDHAQTQFSIDNQPITDQQSRIYSNQISPDAVQSMEVITGVPPAEYGDKSSLVVHIVTKSGLDSPKPSGTLTGGYGSFKSPQAERERRRRRCTKVGDFISFSGLRTDRFLDPPEFEALARPRHERVVLQPAGLPPGRLELAASQRPGGALVVRRAEHARCGGRRPGSTPEDRDRSTSRRAIRASSEPAR